MGSTEYSSSSYFADMKKFRQLALGSQEFSFEYGGSSADYRNGRVWIFIDIFKILNISVLIVSEGLNLGELA